MLHALLTRRAVILSAVALGCAAPDRAALAQNYPERPVRIVVPLGPGGVADIIARIVADKLSDKFGKRFYIENMPSPDGLTALHAALGAAPDGYTLLMLTGGIASSIALYKQFPIDVLNDFVPISSIGYFDCLMVVNAQSELKNLGDFLKAARAKPGTLNVGTISAAGVQRLTANYLKQASGADFVIVPFRTTPDAIVALMRNDVQMVIDFYAALKPGLQNQQMRAIAWAGATPSSALPEIETASEQGVKGFAASTGNTLYAKAGTPADVIAALNKALHEVLADADVKNRLLDLGVVSKASTPAETDAQVRAEIKKWAEVIDRAGIEKH
ncbi:MAG: tripartite tricarboxylate transporter substrate-binding protein [Xanthobacteraceae bacterium]|jgi:tripartite-type tricarboxylate transporter receptor subunit TctC